MKSNIEYLRELLTTDEQIEFLNAISDEIGDLKDKVQEKNIEIGNLKDDKESLEGDIDDMNEAGKGFRLIKNPMGSVEYRASGSLNIVQFMESIEPKIRAL